MYFQPPYGASGAYPPQQGMYDPRFEKDACGLAMVATLRGEARHDIVSLALEALRNLEHRGAVGSDSGTGDGAGILVQMPDAFFREELPFDLPPAGEYAAGIAFLPTPRLEREKQKRQIERIAAVENLHVLGWREVPVDPSHLGRLARDAQPAIEQLFVASAQAGHLAALRGVDLDRRAYRLRKRAQHEVGAYFVTMSARTIGYKGMVTTLQLEPFYLDLQDARFASQLAIVHSRYSTNTFPSWPLAQPLRMMAHNGEINTVSGNRNWMRARQSQLASDLLGDIEPILPICSDGESDSASFDEVLELLELTGRSLAHVMMMMVPEAYENKPDLDPDLRAFYDYNAGQMEPWDGPAALIATDGAQVVATLDRNGLRPGRWTMTTDGLVVAGSETGILEFPAERIARRGRLRPGALFVVDTAEGRIVPDDEVKQQIASSAPWREWLDEGIVRLADMPEREHLVHPAASIRRRQRTFGYTEEELRILIGPMGRTGAEPLGAMGSDAPIAVLSGRPRLLFDYFVQQFAQVTNPPLDSIREEVVTSLKMTLGGENNLLTWGPEHARQIALDFPVIDNDELAKIQHIGRTRSGHDAVTISALYRVTAGAKGMQKRLEQMCREADRAIANGANLIVISDRDSDQELAPIPSLLAVSAVHHHLIRQETRMMVGLVAEAGDVREVHHVAALIGFGASAVNPYLAMETVEHLVRSGEVTGVQPDEAVGNLIYGARQGRAEDHVEDRHRGGLVVRRCAGVRGGRALARSRREALHRHRVEDRRHGARRSSPRRPRPDTRSPIRATARRSHTSASGPAASTSGAGTAHRTCSPRRPCSVCSTRRAPAGSTSSVSTRSSSTIRRPNSRRFAACSRSRRACAPRCRSTRSNPIGVHRLAVLDGRDELRIHLAGSARDARDRDEPPGRQVEHR